MERDEALALLRDQHAFPGPFSFRVIVTAVQRDAVIESLRGVMGGGRTLLDIDEHASRNGTWLRLRVAVHVPDAEDVLALYATLKDCDGVVMTM